MKHVLLKNALAALVMTGTAIGAGVSALADTLPVSDAPPSVGGWVEVSTAAQLEYIDQNQGSYLNSNIELMNNIDLSGYTGWVPFGGDLTSNMYNGTFDGQGHEITGLTINDTTDTAVGFFGSARTIRNLGVVDATVTAGSGTNIAEGVLVADLSSVGGTNGSITNCFTTGSVVGGAVVVGGLVGQNDGTITNSYSTASVSTSYGSVGGLVGLNNGDIYSSYATGSVSGGPTRGGLIGTETGSVNGSFFDETTTGQSSGDGVNDGGLSASTAETTAQMQTASTFTAAGWNFTNTWGISPYINNGYPYLRALYSSYIPKDVTPPSTQASTTGKQGKNGWYVSPVQLTLNATDDLSGVAATYYRTDGGTTWQTYSSPVSFSSDGKYNVEYYSVDNTGNKETAHSVSFNIDQTAPSISTTAPTNGNYLDDQSLTVAYSVSDSLSGVDNSSVGATLDGQSTANGKTIPLYTLSLGSYTFTVNASDNAGNTATQSVTFQVSTSLDSLKQLVSQFTSNGSIDNGGISKALTAKLDSGSLQAFVNQVQAQSGKHISATAGAYLLRDANYLLGQ